MGDRIDAGQDRCRTGVMQDRSDAGQDRCRMFFVRFFGPRKINILFRFYY